MSDGEPKATINSRQYERVEIDDRISVRFDVKPVDGSGQNISEQGVFFVAEGRIPVHVEIEGREGSLPGEVVRIENMGEGMVGIAVKFDETHPDLLESE